MRKLKYIKLLQQKFKPKNVFLDPFFYLKDNFKPKLRLKNNFYTHIINLKISVIKNLATQAIKKTWLSNKTMVYSS